MKLVVLDVVGLRPKDLAHAPNIRRLAERGFMAPQETVFPAVTCTVQATWLTGHLPRRHGAVANGWYFRNLAQIWLWRQANQLVQGDKVYELAGKELPEFSCAKMFWWWNMYADVGLSVTPRPEYHADGLKKPGLYSQPPGLAPSLQTSLGDFPLFHFWGPMADILSTRWIADASLQVMAEHDPQLTLIYLPHLDYNHQRLGPDHPDCAADVAAVDAEAGKLIDAALARGAEVMVLSEYGIEAAHKVVFPNRALHEQGLLQVQETSHGQLLDPGASRAFAVADHQCAHIYIRDPSDIARVRQVLEGLEGVDQVLDRQGQHDLGIDHSRAGELVAVASKGAWFAYHYWLDEARRPDFATTVDIHRKPGYDPTELFVNPELKLPKLRIAKRLLQKKLGMRYLMDVIGTDPSLVRGTHGRLFEEPDAGPLFIHSNPNTAADSVKATEVRDRMMRALRA